jgi:4'-phosphopantetheinyl transferase
VVEVWVTDLDRSWDGPELCSPDEVQRASSFRRALSGARWLSARRALRRVLADRIGPTVVFETGPHGKPAAAGHPDVEFSVSHTGAHALIAVATTAVGVDVEEPGRVIDAGRVARRLWSTPPTIEPAAVLRQWVRTEAVLKATGAGWSGGGRDAVRRLAAAGWSVVDLDLPLVAAVAAREPGTPEVRYL